MGIPKNGGLYILENPIKIDNLGVPPFQEISIFKKTERIPGIPCR